MIKPKKLVLFDIDHTVFNTNLYRSNLYANLAAELGYDPNDFYEIGENVYQEIRKTNKYLDPDPFLENILTHSKRVTDLKKLNSVFWDKKLYEACIFPDVKKTFSYLSENKIQIGIFSTGDLAHQKIKVESLKEYLTDNHIYISPDKFKVVKGTLAAFKKTRIYLVDDYPQILESAKTHNKNVFTVFIKRTESYKNMVIPENFKPDATITNLSQLTDIIKANN